MRLKPGELKGGGWRTFESPAEWTSGFGKQPSFQNPEWRLADFQVFPQPGKANQKRESPESGREPVPRLRQFVLPASFLLAYSLCMDLFESFGDSAKGLHEIIAIEDLRQDCLSLVPVAVEFGMRSQRDGVKLP